MADYVMRDGRKIEVVHLTDPTTRKKRRRSFEYQWVKLPRHWVTALANTKSAATYRLALIILVEAFKRKHTGGKIVLSAKTVPEMYRGNRLRAAWELVDLGLIEIEVDGNKATTVSRVNL